MSMSLVPTVGRIVHLTQKGSPEHVPAVICYVHPSGAHRSNPALDGTLLNVGCWDVHGEPTPGIQGVPEDQTGSREMSWHWPERINTAQDGSPEKNFVTYPLSQELEERVRTLEDLLIAGKSDDDSDPEVEEEEETEDEEDDNEEA